MGQKHYAEMQSLLQREGGGGQSICLGLALEMLQVIKSGWLRKSITPLGLPLPPRALEEVGVGEEAWGLARSCGSRLLTCTAGAKVSRS